MEAIRKLINSKAYAEVRDCSVRTIEREREGRNGCPYVQLGRRIYYRPEDVERFIAAHVRSSEKALAVAPPQGEQGRDDAATLLKRSRRLRRKSPEHNETGAVPCKSCEGIT
jgi:hypothetical protein